jgi:hypothetical protein
MLPLNLTIAHGRLISHGKSPGRVCRHSLRAYENTNQTTPRQSKAARGIKTKKETALEMRVRRRQEDSVPDGWLSPDDRNWL